MVNSRFFEDIFNQRYLRYGVVGCRPPGGNVRYLYVLLYCQTCRLTVRMILLFFEPMGSKNNKLVHPHRDFDRYWTDKRHVAAEQEARWVFLFNSNNCQRRTSDLVYARMSNKKKQKLKPKNDP